MITPYQKTINELISKAEKGNIKINLGCGSDYRKEYINCDNNKNFKYDLEVDLNKKLPFKNNYADSILMVSVIEHIEDAFKLLKEIHRVLKPGGILIITTPHFTNPYQFADYSRKHFGSYMLFKTLCSDDYSKDFKFKEQKIKILFAKGILVYDYILEPIVNKFPTLYEYTPLSCFRAWEVYAEMKK